MEKILLFQPEDAAAIRKIALPLKIRVKEIEVSSYGHTLGYLAGVTKEEEAAVYEGEALEGSLMVFCNFTEKHFNTVLLKMRQNKVPMTYKAVMTPVNRTWTIPKLYAEVELEKKSYENR